MAPRVASGGRSPWAAPALAIVTTFLTLALLEAGSYLLGDFEAPVQPLQVGNLKLYGRHDPLLFWSLKPGAQLAGGTLWINADGIRGPAIGSKQSGEFRILSLGESTTFAAQMSYDLSYSAVLEQMLQSGREPIRTRVMNAGVPGYSLFQGTLYLRERSAALEPDVALLYFGYNDFLPVAFLAERAGGAAVTPVGHNDWELYDQRQALPYRVFSALLRVSNLVRGLAGAAARRSEGSLERDEGRVRVPEDHRRRLIRMAKHYADRSGIGLVLIIPIYREFDRHAALLRELATAESIPLVDLPARLSETFHADPGRYFLDTVHPSPLGHRRIAEAIFEVVDAEVPRPDPPAPLARHSSDAAPLAARVALRAPSLYSPPAATPGALAQASCAPPADPSSGSIRGNQRTRSSATAQRASSSRRSSL